MRMINDQRFEEVNQKYDHSELETGLIDAGDSYHGLPSHKEAVIFFFGNYQFRHWNNDRTWILETEKMEAEVVPVEKFFKMCKVIKRNITVDYGKWRKTHEKEA